MSACIRSLQAPRLYPSVGLGRAYRGVAEQLLDRAQIGPALEQMGGERMTQRVGRHPGLARLEVQAAPHVRGRQPATALGQELLEGGAPGLHFYTLNRSTATREIFARLSG